MKNRSKVLSLGLLVICFAIFAVGVYALKNATLTASGTIGFTAHNCNIWVYGKITGAVTNQDDMSGEAQELYLVNYADDDSAFSKEAYFDFTGTKELTFDNDLYSYNEETSTASHQTEIFFDDSRANVPNIVITLYLKNNSAFPVTVKVRDITVPAGIEVSKSNLTRLANDASSFSTLTITLRLTNKEDDIAASPKNFSLPIDFYKERPQLQVPQNVVVNTESKTVTFDAVKGATSYEILYYEQGKTSGAPAFTQEVTEAGTVELSPEIKDKVNYVVKVRAVRLDEYGDKDYSDFSEETPFIIITATPAKYFTYEQNAGEDTYAITGYTGGGLYDEIILPRAFSRDASGNITDVAPGESEENIFRVDRIKGTPINDVSGTSGFKEFAGSIVLLDNITSLEKFAFNYSKSITKITLPASLIKTQEKVFVGCESLKTVYYNGTLEKWCNIDWGSEGACTNGAALYIDNTLVTEANFEGYTQVKNYAFDGCTSLKTLTFPTDLTTIGLCAFRNCTALPRVTIPASITLIKENAFAGCEKLHTVYYEGTLQEWCEMELYLYSNPCTNSADLYVTSQKQLVIEATFEGNREVKNYIFDGCKSLKTVTIPYGIKTIGKFAFFHCIGINKLTISETVNEIGVAAFSQCSELPTVTVPEGVTIINVSTFGNCSKLTSISLPVSLRNIELNSFAFDNNLCKVYYAGTLEQWCKNIEMKVNPLSYAHVGEGVEHAIYVTASKTKVTSVNFGDFSNYTKIMPYIFSGCDSLTSVTIPEGIREIGEGALEYTSIKNVTIPTSVTVLGKEVFLGCAKLAKVTLLGRVNAITSDCFEFCTSLSSIELPDGVQSIHPAAFAGCSSLQTIVIPASLTEIYMQAFGVFDTDSCNLLRVYYKGNASQYAALKNSTLSKEFVAATVYYQVADAAASKTATGNWWYYNNSSIVYGTNN